MMTIVSEVGMIFWKICGVPGARRRCHKVSLHVYDLDSFMARDKVGCFVNIGKDSKEAVTMKFSVQIYRYTR